MPERIFLSPPHMSGKEIDYIQEAFASNYIAPLGPQVDAFEAEVAVFVGAKHAVALSSGTAGLHLALRYAHVGPGDEVFCSTFTFVSSANAILYLGARPVFIDSEKKSWNMDPEVLAAVMAKRARVNKLPKAVVVVHLYGQCADLQLIKSICDAYGVALIEDAAESLGATYRGKASGTFGLAGIFSFNGNKIITTSGGGMLVSDDEDLVEKIRFWATQARDNAPHYEHSQMGYNYRLSNVLAAIGRGQIQVLPQRVKRKQEIFLFYKRELEGLPGITFMPEVDYGTSTKWLTCVTITKETFGADREDIRLALEKEKIESRPLWKPMHLQPMFSDCEVFGNRVADELFRCGLCLPSGTQLSRKDLLRITNIIKGCRGNMPKCF